MTQNNLEFIDRNNTNFPISSAIMLENLLKDKMDFKDSLQYHQYIIYTYLIKNVKNRGILLYHEMGMGKSRTSVAIAEYYRKYDKNRKIIVLLAKSLQKNYKMNIEEFVKINNITDDWEDKYHFISMNASNMYAQISKVNKSKAEIILEKNLESFDDDIGEFLENSLLIIDEYHNLSNSITNGSSNAIKLYDKIINTKDIKLIFMTGTPIVNTPFELAPTFNMLAGTTDLFPELKKSFNTFFVDYKNKKIKNKNFFQNRIFGLVSYYGNEFQSKKSKDFPEQLPIKVEKVPMSSKQFAQYMHYREIEKEEDTVRKKPDQSERFTSKKATTSSYRVKTRQISNFLIPPSALTYEGKKVIKHPELLDKELTKLEIYSPKFKKILENIKKHKNQLGLFYSEFVSGEGVNIFVRVLKKNNYVQYKIKKNDEFDIVKVDKTIDNNGFAIITGDTEYEDREKIVKIFNSEDNKHGKLISLLIISKTGAEGLDLKNVRHIHICEPFWNISRINQIISRGVRYKSHTALPVKEHTVQPYIYLSDFPEDHIIKKVKIHKDDIETLSKTVVEKDRTTDVSIYENALENYKLINQFNIALIESSVDCSFSSKSIKCKVCMPDDKKLYDYNISKQIKIPDPCKIMKTEKVKLNEIDVDGIKYYYNIESESDLDDSNKSDKSDKSDKSNKSDLSKKASYNFEKIRHIYKYDKDLKGYIEVQSNEDIYSKILLKILDW